ncbi:HTH-like domain-containing protein [Nitrosospira sp. Nsp1]|nr:HTH-like domain-containing protein [Nitrosospira sp. Nsp1]
MSDRALEDERLLILIRDSYMVSGKIYGSPRVFGDLREAGEQYGKHRVARLMRGHQIRAVRRYKAPKHIAGRPSIVSPNRLKREFGMGNGYDLDPHLARLAVPGCNRGSIRPQGGRVVHEADTGSRAGP